MLSLFTLRFPLKKRRWLRFYPRLDALEAHLMETRRVSEGWNRVYPRLDALEGRFQPGNAFFGGFWGFGLLGLEGAFLDSQAATAIGASQARASLFSQRVQQSAVLADALALDPFFFSENDRSYPSQEQTSFAQLGRGIEGNDPGPGITTDFPAWETAPQLLNTPLVSPTLSPHQGVDGSAAAVGKQSPVSWTGLIPPSPSLTPGGQAEPGTRALGNLSSLSPMASVPPTANLYYDAPSGQLIIRPDPGDNTVREVLTPDGFLEVTLNGQRHSSNPASANFDENLSGAGPSTVAGILYESNTGHDTLTLGSQNVAGSFAVAAGNAEVVAEDISVAGRLAIEAQRITVQGQVHGGTVELLGTGWVDIEAKGSVSALENNAGGQIDVATDVFVNAGQLHADGQTGGQIVVRSRNVLNAGPITANGDNGSGGLVQENFTGSYIDTTAALTSANGTPGGSVRIDGGTTGRLYGSGTQEAMGTTGGAIDLSGREVVLNGNTVDASGELGGGRVGIGRNVGHVSNVPAFAGQAGSPPYGATQSVTVTGASTICANALHSGNGGQVVVWADQENQFGGSVEARGGLAGGDGGFIEVSGKGTLYYSGSSDSRATLGKTGTLLLDPKNIIISEAPVGVFPQFDLIDPHPTNGGRFGDTEKVTNNGNIVVTSPFDNFGGNMAGAIYLFNGLSGALISSLVSNNPNDRLGVYPVTLLRNGNYLVPTPNWNSNRGAVTFGNGTTGISGIISNSNSLVGSNAADYLGCFQFLSGNCFSVGITPLSNGNYVVNSPNWNGQRGEVTWGNGTTGVTGPVSETNSLIGSISNDGVGGDGIFLLSNGNYVVGSQRWSEERGAVTWGDRNRAVSGIVSGSNSLVGSQPQDRVGTIIALNNGNYVVESIGWNGNRGAATWGNGTTGVSGTVSETNSLIGTNANDGVSRGYILPLTDGNYVVGSPNWNDDRGAVTWGDGTKGISGTISGGNSLVGSQPQDRVGGLIFLLTNGNYVVGSPGWNGNRGAVTWRNSTKGVSGTVSENNSLVGSNSNDGVGGTVTALSNGNYVVRSPNWNSGFGAATWGDGTTGVRGTVSDANSLVGTSPNDHVGAASFRLSNGNYVVISTNWNGQRGAVTWGNGTMGITGPVSDANSLVGGTLNDQVGLLGITLLSNGNYVVLSLNWNGRRGAATWGSGLGGTTGTVSDTNSLVGSSPNDFVGRDGVTVLRNGNYVVGSSWWNDFRGAATWGDGTAGVKGVVTEDNSLVGTDPDERVAFRITPLSNGNYVVGSPGWSAARGAGTWGNGAMGVSGSISQTNSLVGSNPNDEVGFLVNPLENGNYVVGSPYWNGNRGAATWANGITGVNGTVSVANSLVGTSPNDLVGDLSSFFPLSNGNYLVNSANWNERRGAVTWVNGATGQTVDDRGIITTENSLVGRTPNSGLTLAVDPVHPSFLARFVTEGGGRVTAGLPDPNQCTYARAQAQTVTLTPGFLTNTLNSGTDVVLQASNDITVEDPIIVNANGKGGALTLQAGRSILVNANITTDNGPLTLIANDTLANGVVDSQREPGNASIIMAPGTQLDTGTGALTVELRNGAGRTNTSSRAINLQTITSGSVNVVNNGPSAGSDVRLASVTTTGSQTYSDPNGITTVTGNLTAVDNPITFTDSVVVNDNVTVDAGSSTVNFAGLGTQTLHTGTGSHFGTVVHNGTGTLQLTSALMVGGSFAATFGAIEIPTTSTGLVSVAGSVAFTAAATEIIHLDGTESSQVMAGGPIDLGGSTLNLILDSDPTIGIPFTLLATTDPSPIKNTFAGLDEGTIFTQGGFQFQITYMGGNTGNSVVLTRVA